MLKKMLVMLAVMFLMAGPVLADSFTITGVGPGRAIDGGWVGQANVKVNGFDTWGYCIEKTIRSYLAPVVYDATIKDFTTNSMFFQANLIYNAYYEVTPLIPVTDDEARDLQNAIWAGGTFNGGDARAALLLSMFKWADIPNIDGCGQDFIIRVNSVPEPTTLLLLGLGLVGMGVAARRKFVK